MRCHMLDVQGRRVAKGDYRVGEAVSTLRTLLLIAHHRECTEGKETQDRQGKRYGNGLRCRMEMILQELFAIGGTHLARFATVKSKASHPKPVCCSPECSRKAVC